MSFESSKLDVEAYLTHQDLGQACAEIKLRKILSTEVVAT